MDNETFFSNIQECEDMLREAHETLSNGESPCVHCGSVFCNGCMYL